MLKRADLFFLPFIYGFVTLGFQILFVRRLISIFGPSEIGYSLIITFWLLLTGVGAYICEKMRLCRVANYNLMALYGLIAVILYGLIPKFYDIWNLAPGEITGFMILGASAFIVLFILCIFSGALFVGIVESVSWHTNRTSLPIVYVIESLGALASGLLMTIAFTLIIPDRYIALGLFLLLFLVMLFRIEKRYLLAPPRITVGIMCLFAGAAFALGQFGFQYGEQNVVAVADTPVQHLTLTEYEGQYTLFADGHRVYSIPDQASAELIHMTLWQKAQFDKIGLLGLPAPETLEELLKYDGLEIHVFEQDRHLLNFLHQNLPTEYSAVFTHPAIEYHWGDPYYLVNEVRDDYDFIILNYTNPVDAAGNRYFTIEFARDISRKIGREGIYAFCIDASDNLLRQDIHEYFAIINNTLSTEFREVRVIPGQCYTFLASNSPDIISLNPQSLYHNIRIHDIETSYVDSVFVSYALDPFQLLKADAVYENGSLRINRIDEPFVYYFNSILWAQRASEIEESVLKFFRDRSTFLYALILLPAIPLLFMLKRRRTSPYYGICFLAGFAGITLEILFLVMYQAQIGTIYSQMGILVGLSMVGIAVGGFSVIKLKEHRLFKLYLLFLSLFLVAVVVAGSFIALNYQLDLIARQVLIFVLAFLSGIFSGFLFNFAASAFKARVGMEFPGRFYLFDLVGATLAGLFVSALLIPLLGLSKILLMVVLLMVVYAILHIKLIRS